MKSITGKIVSTRNSKTIIVEVERQSFYPTYEKIVRRSKKYKAHYEGKDLKCGDTVEIVSSRPYSKDKHYKFLKKI